MIDVGDCLLNVSGDGPVNGPGLMPSNSMGRTMEMWEPQVTEFAQRFRVVRYDRRGHGTSGVPDGPYSIEQLGRDVLAILDHLKPARVNWCGISIGGIVWQWLGARAPEHLDRIILSNTSSYFRDPSNWLDRINDVQANGVASPTAPPREAYIARYNALSTLDQRALLPRNSRPTLVIAGRHDKIDPT
jgi:3-oxoadipate enol-lactonase